MSHTAIRLVHISDPHLSAKRSYAHENWEAVLRYLESDPPDLVVCTGDIVFDDPDDDEDHDFGRSQLERIPAPWLVVPGNHDVGDAPPDPWQDQETTPDRLARYRQRYGADWWVKDLFGWRLVGINSQLFSTGLPDEEAQWEFLQDALSQAGGTPTALFAHKTPCMASLDEDVFHNNTIPPMARRRLAPMLRSSTVRFVAAGHLHVYGAFMTEGIAFVWAPTTGLISTEDSLIWNGALARNGVVEYLLAGDNFRFRLVEPPDARLVDYGDLDPSVPRGSRFLPLKPLRNFAG